MIHRIQALPLLLVAAAGVASAQAQDPTGRWRLTDEQGRRGTLVVQRGADGRLTYDRAVRADVTRDAAHETGAGQLGEFMDLAADEGPGLSNLGFGAARATARGRYRATPEGGWLGVRQEGARRSRERLDPWRAGVDGHRVDVLTGTGAFAAMRVALDSATTSIEIQTFQWADDENGREFAAKCIAKARAGVRVLVLVDASSKTVNQLEKKKDYTDGLDDQMRAGGVLVLSHHGYGKAILGSVANVGAGLWRGVKRLFGGNPPPREKRGMFNHDHRKLILVDGRVGFIGGMNVADEYEHVWHDVVARVEGPVVHAMHLSILDRWKAAGGEVPADLAAMRPATFDPPAGDLPVEYLVTIPGVSTPIVDWYLRSIEAARQKILIEMAYFLDDRIIQGLCRAAGRKVRTVVIIPSDEKNDVYLVKEAFAWVQNDVVRAGVELYKYQPALTHAKVATFDGRTSTIGSSNLDRLALDEIAEANIVVPDPRFARVMEQKIFAVDLPKSVRVTVQPLPFKRKLTAGTLHFFRRFL